MTQIDFLPKIEQEPLINTPTELPKRKPRRKHRGALFILLIILVGSVIYFTRNPENKPFLENFGQMGFLQQIKNLITSSNKNLSGETDGRINILLLGMAGAGYDGVYLTDTMMLISLNPKTGQIAMLSIPRDLLVNVPNEGWKKINSVNAYAETQNPGSGETATKKMVSNVFDLPIQYYIRVDFDGFAKLVDSLGGIGVYVDKSFTDNLYPDDQGKAHTISFKSGWQVMDGATALKFSRSRHGDNNEGSDFARGARQQKVLLALKEKIISLNTLMNPSRISSIMNNLVNHIRTDMQIWEVLRLAKLSKTMKNNTVIHYVFDNSLDGVLYAADYDGAFVLRPKGDNFDELRYIAKNIFDLPADYKHQLTEAEKKLVANIEILNGTGQEGLAKTMADSLAAMGYTVAKFGNAEKKDYSQTIIYDFTGGQKTKRLDELKKKFNTKTVYSAAHSLSEPNLDFKVILGNDIVSI